MAKSFVGVGDLHLDGKLQRFIPNLNEVIIEEVNKALEYARRNGIKLIIFYGDICETPKLSYDASSKLLDLIVENEDLLFIFITGNHDFSSDEHNSMLLFKKLANSGKLKNLRVYDKPKTLFASSGTPIRLLPWPSADTREDCLNVIHIEVAGARWDHGREVNSKIDTEHICVAGHIHTRQKVRNTYFSGTLYQTSFGEKPKKYFHHVYWNGPDDYSVKHIRNAPRFQLVNLVIETEEDLSKIEKNPNFLYKVFVKKGVILDSDAFGHFPNVVRINSFSTAEQLKVLLHEDLEVDDLSGSAVISIEDTLKGWLVAAEISDELRKRTWKKFKTLQS